MNSRFDRHLYRYSRDDRINSIFTTVSAKFARSKPIALAANFPNVFPRQHVRKIFLYFFITTYSFEGHARRQSIGSFLPRFVARRVSVKEYPRFEERSLALRLFRSSRRHFYNGFIVVGRFHCPTPPQPVQKCFLEGRIKLDGDSRGI